jgi:hypothetical protein
MVKPQRCVRCGELKADHADWTNQDPGYLPVGVCPKYVEPASGWLRALNSLLAKVNK